MSHAHTMNILKIHIHKAQNKLKHNRKKIKKQDLK